MANSEQRSNLPILMPIGISVTNVYFVFVAHFLMAHFIEMANEKLENMTARAEISAFTPRRISSNHRFSTTRKTELVQQHAEKNGVQGLMFKTKAWQISASLQLNIMRVGD